MEVHFESSGKLKEILQIFKTQYLTQLTEEDLQSEVVLSIRERSDEPAEHSSQLKEKLIEVIEND